MTGLSWMLAAFIIQPQTPLFRTTTEIVQVDVYVGRDGRAVLGLGASDFELFEDGERQELDLVDAQNIPVHIALVLDTSGSVAGIRLSHLREAAIQLLDDLDDEDEAALISFSHHLKRDAELMRDKDQVRDAIEAVEAYGATAWHDALFVGLKTVENVEHRPMVLLFTDGIDTYSWLREEQMLPLVEQSQAVIYAIGRKERLPKFGRGTLRHSALARDRARRAARDANAERTRLLRKLTETSGGRFIETDTTENLGPIFSTILAEIKTRYLLSYRPREPIHEGWHTLSVKVNVRGVEVHARRGYFYEKKR